MGKRKEHTSSIPQLVQFLSQGQITGTETKSREDKEKRGVVTEVLGVRRKGIRRNLLSCSLLSLLPLLIV